MGTKELVIEPDVTPAAPAPKARRSRFRVSRTNLTLTLVVIAGVALWEVLARLEIIDPLFVSYPSEILAQIPELAADEDVRLALFTTGEAMIWASLYGTLVGIVLGYLMGFFAVFRDAFYGPALFLMSVPKSIFIPVFMVFFGINIQTAIYYGAFSAFVYVLVNVVGGFDLIQERHLKVARAYGASLRHRIIDVVLPASLPGVFTGIWYGIKQGLQGVLIFELFVSVGGLGQLITFYTNSLRADRVFAIILGVSLVAILGGSAWTAFENRLSRWRPSSDKATTT